MYVHVAMSDDTTQDDERRERRRTSIALDLELVAPEVSASTPSRTINLSSQGAFVRTSRPLPVGTRLKVAFSRGELRNPLTLDAVVVRAIHEQNGSARGMALQFTDVTELDENIVSDLIQRARS